MSCAWIDRDDVFERYVRETPGADERDSFEEHVLGCAACAERLEMYRLLRLELANAVTAEAPAAVPRPSRPWWLLPLATAAGLVLVASVLFWMRDASTRVPEATVATAPAVETPPAPIPAPATAATGEARPPVPPATSAPSPGRAAPAPAAPRVPIAVLARVEPPIYLPVSLRGPVDEAAERFHAGMQRYVAKDFAGAVPDLAAAVSLNPKAPNATFFLAICELLTGDVESAAAGLQTAIALGESPYLEEAHFYLAKARLQQGDIGSAREELERVVERGGRLEREARDLLEQLK